MDGPGCRRAGVRAVYGVAGAVAGLLLEVVKNLGPVLRNGLGWGPGRCQPYPQPFGVGCRAWGRNWWLCS